MTEHNKQRGGAEGGELELQGGPRERARGGDIILQAGQAGRLPDGTVPPELGGSIIFRLPDGTDHLRISPEGWVYVKGSLVKRDAAMYEALAAWLQAAIGEYPGAQ